MEILHPPAHKIDDILRLRVGNLTQKQREEQSRIRPLVQHLGAIAGERKLRQAFAVLEQMQIPLRFIPLQLAGRLQQPGRFVQNQQSILRHVIVQGVVLGVNQGDIFIDFRKINMLPHHFDFPGDFLFQLIFGLAVGHFLQLPVKPLLDCFSRPLQPFAGSDKFFTRGNVDLLDLLDGTLIGRVESTDRIDFIIEQLDPISDVRGQRIEIDDPPADAHLPARFDAFHPLVTQLDHPCQKVIQHQRAAQFDRQPGIRHRFRRGYKPADAGIRHDHNPPERPGALQQYLDALSQGLGARNRRFGGYQLIGRIEHHLFR
ncbi:hypothetical protein D1872_232000 [compost metagenome]